MTKEKKKTIKERLAKLLKPLKKVFASNKETAAEYLEKKKGEAQIMMDAVNEILRQNRARNAGNLGHLDDKGSEDVYLYDFIDEYSNGHGATGFTHGPIVMGDNEFEGGAIANPWTEDATLVMPNRLKGREPKKKVKPKDIVEELERVPTPVTLQNLEEKIAVLKIKEEFIRNNSWAKHEVIDMVLRLENRRKYAEYKSFFEKFDNTTIDKVNDLLNKYDIVLKPSDLFIAKFPKDAMDIMKAYKTEVKKLCGKLPVFYVIAENSMFKKEERRNDPILLVQSPFGQYFQILGAWDKELILLDEL